LCNVSSVYLFLQGHYSFSSISFVTSSHLACYIKHSLITNPPTNTRNCSGLVMLSYSQCVFHWQTTCLCIMRILNTFATRSECCDPSTFMQCLQEN
jgi:hypothetical protein